MLAVISLCELWRHCSDVYTWCCWQASDERHRALQEHGGSVQLGGVGHGQPAATEAHSDRRAGQSHGHAPRDVEVRPHFLWHPSWMIVIDICIDVHFKHRLVVSTGGSNLCVVAGAFIWVAEWPCYLGLWSDLRKKSSNWLLPLFPSRWGTKISFQLCPVYYIELNGTYFITLYTCPHPRLFSRFTIFRYMLRHSATTRRLLAPAL